MWTNSGRTAAFASPDPKGARSSAHCEELVAKFAAIFANPRQLVFDWPSREITVEGDVAWVFAEGDLIIRSAEGDERKVYNATFVFQRLDGRWRWRQFFGSEPR